MKSTNNFKQIISIILSASILISSVESIAGIGTLAPPGSALVIGLLQQDIPDFAQNTFIQLEVIKYLMQDENFAWEMAKYLHDAYYEDIGQPAPHFPKPSEAKTAEEAKKIKENIAINLAGFIALECGITHLCIDQNKQPMQIIEAIITGKVIDKDMYLLASFANGTWQSQQPLREPLLERMKRSVFKPAAFLDEKELEKDVVQIRKAATKLRQVMTRVLIESISEPIRIDFEKKIDELIALVRERRAITKSDERRIRETAHIVMFAHREQKRKDDITPYFYHQLKVARFAILLFGITDPELIRIALLHDTREDQEDMYDDFRQLLINKIKHEKNLDVKEKKVHGMYQVRLGVRVLSKLEGPTYADLEDPVAEYVHRIMKPREAYPPETPGAEKWYTDDSIKALQEIKVCDILANSEDLIIVFENVENPDKEQKALPRKFLGKIMKYFIPAFQNDSLLTEEGKELMIRRLREILENYVNMPRSPLKQRANPLIVAGRTALKKMGSSAQTLKSAQQELPPESVERGRETSQ